VDVSADSSTGSACRAHLVNLELSFSALLFSTLYKNWFFWYFFDQFGWDRPGFLPGAVPQEGSRCDSGACQPLL